MNVKYLRTLLPCLFFITQGLVAHMPLYFCTAANSNYYQHLLNLIGSIHKVNYNTLGHIAVFDLGLTPTQKAELLRIDKLSIHEVEKTHPDILKIFVKDNIYHRTVPGWYAWKPVVLKQSLEMFPYVVWLDAGTTVLRPLDDLFAHIVEYGYFLATIGDGPVNGKCEHNVGWGTTKFVAEQFQLNDPANKWILEKESVMAGVIGVSRNCYPFFVHPLYSLTRDMRFFKDDGTAPNGFGTGRYEQTLMSILAYSENMHIFEQDYQQKVPMELVVKRDAQLHFKRDIVPFYITWHGGYVNEKTHIYSSRNDMGNFQQYVQQIRLKQ